MKRNSLLFTLLCLCALCLIVGCNGDGVLMRQQLEELEQQNSKGEKLVDDSLAESLVTILPNEIAKLEKCIPSYVSYIRKNLLKKSSVRMEMRMSSTMRLAISEIIP